VTSGSVFKILHRDEDLLEICAPPADDVVDVMAIEGPEACVVVPGYGLVCVEIAALTYWQRFFLSDSIATIPLHESFSLLVKYLVCHEAPQDGVLGELRFLGCRLTGLCVDSCSPPRVDEWEWFPSVFNPCPGLQKLTVLNVSVASWEALLEAYD
jgi:hypothetical protein